MSPSGNQTAAEMLGRRGVTGQRAIRGTHRMRAAAASPKSVRGRPDHMYQVVEPVAAAATPTMIVVISLDGVSSDSLRPMGSV